ncbi:hypothetical protein Tco_0636698 [Tanacetum coccineum]
MAWEFKENLKLRGSLFHSWKIRFEDVHVLKVKIATMDHLGIKLFLALDNNPSHPSVSTPVDTEMHKEDMQAAGNLTSLGVASEEGANPQLSSVYSTAGADPGLSAPNDSMPHQQGIDEGTKNYTPDHMFAGTNPSVLVDKTKSDGDGLKTIYTSSAFLAPDSPTNEPIIISDESDEEKDADTNVDTSHVVPKCSLRNVGANCRGVTIMVHVLRRLGSIFTSVYAAVQKLKKDSWKELQFSLVDNSKQNVVYLLNKS